MPLELGIDLGCKAFSRTHAAKTFLIFDSEQHRYQKYLSDIGGQDIQRHSNDPRLAVGHVRNWLRGESEAATIPGGSVIYERYLCFRGELPQVCRDLRLDVYSLTFADLSTTIAAWLKRNR
jgi:hypothetical protein